MLSQNFKIVAGLFILFYIVVPKKSFGHQADISSIILVQNGQGEWLVKVTCSASALEYEVKKHFYKIPYTSKEEFEQQALLHIKNNLKITANGSDKIAFTADFLKLGHESQVMFKLKGMPADVRSLTINNTSFSDIKRSQSFLMILQDGNEKSRFILDQSNQYSQDLNLSDNQWQATQSNNDAALDQFSLLLIGISILTIGLFLYRLFSIRSKNKFTLTHT